MSSLIPTSRLLIGVLFFALLLRLFTFFFVEIEPVSDALDYIHIAQELINSHQFVIDGQSTAYRLPGYPFFLAGLFSIFKSVQFVQIIQIFLDICSCYLIYKIALVYTSPRKSIIACLAWAVFPSAIVQTLFLLTETLFTTLFLSAFLLYLKNDNSKNDLNRLPMLVLGIVWGICCLIKPFMIFAPLSFIVIAIAKREKLTTHTFQKIALTFIGILCIIIPWMTRNYRTFNEFSLGSNGGVNFWIGNNPMATGTYYFPDNNPLDSISDEFKRSSYGYKAGLDFIKHNPNKSAILAIKKVGYFFSLESPLIIAIAQMDELYTKKTSYRTLYKNTPIGLLLLFNAPYCIIIMCGIVGLCHRTNMLLPTLYFILFWIFIHIVYFSQNRFHFPVLPLFIVAAAGLSPKNNMTRLSMLSSAGLIFAFLSIVAAEIYVVWFM